ncbi:hypothetical protein ACFL3B_01210 [Gemmatimonadota bacterium]
MDDEDTPASESKVGDKKMIKNSMSSLLLVWVLGCGHAVAQNDNTHKGFWLSFGGGGGWMDGERSASSYFRMGGTPNSQVHFGGQVLHWWQDDEIQHSNVSATFAVYPFYSSTRPRGPLSEWFVKTGFGVAVAHDHWHDQTGVGLNLGTGIDLRLNKNFFVTPNLDCLVDFFNESTDMSFLFTLGLSWH